MNNIFSKLRDLVGLNDPVEYEYEYEEEGDDYQHPYQEESPQMTPEEERRRRRIRERVTLASEPGVEPNMNNVVGMPRAINSIAEVIVMEPRSFEEMPQVIQALRERKSVVLNLTMMDPDQAQRAVDFVAGGTFAIEGHQERVGESIFLFTPICVQVTTQSGVVHQAPPQVLHARPVTPTPAWTPDSTRIAQSS
ncbi:MAG: cell division protein SepF [Chroococcidiopsidaceae cyanobacterium CP_BM_ER_R8_30]|nr:cell division protein SepF [Chroococcidiopsidaceae cyanobacterium CP_BM_ER_R8_30]